MSDPASGNPTPDDREVGGAAAPRGLFYYLGRVEVVFAQIAVVVMTVLVLASAITRSLGHPQAWTVDVATFAFAWAVFVGADVALRKGRMVRIDIVLNRLPERFRDRVSLVNDVIVVAFLVAMVILGTILSIDTSERTFSGLPWLSYTWVTVSVPVGCALMLWTVARGIPGRMKALRGTP